MYQIEVKYHLILREFPPQDGWKVTVDLDAMEMGKGKQNPPEKRVVAEEIRKLMDEQGVAIGPHSKYGRADVVAEKPGVETFIIEVEGDSRRQREQAVYSALGQLIMIMETDSDSIRYGVAVPDRPEWKEKLEQIPPDVRKALKLDLFLVAKDDVTRL